MKSFSFPLLALTLALPSVAQEKPVEPADATLDVQVVPLPKHLRFPSPFDPAGIAPAGTSTSDKFHRYVRETFNPGRQLSSAASSAFNEMLGGSGEWGTGGGAYANRIGSQMAAQAVRNSIRFGFDATLKTDSRYRRSKAEGVGARLGHALLSTVVTNKDDGGRIIAVPQIAAAYGGAFAANMWYPNTRNSTSDALMRGTSTLIWTAGKNVLREFWPDIKKLFGG